MIENEMNVTKEIEQVSNCNCGFCELKRQEKTKCQCERCRKKEMKRKPKRDHCKWYNVDQSRARRRQHSKHNKQKFIWEIDCECANCSNH